MTLSRSRPPSFESPRVAYTSSMPSDAHRTEISNVPPPRSKTSTFLNPSLVCKLQATAAAVGSLIMRIGLSPAMRAASRVAFFYVFVK